MKLSKRLQVIADYVDSDDKIVDVGCDHGYLDIYLAKEKKNKLIIASDISDKVIKNTKTNIKKFKLQDKILVYTTNGTDNIKEDFDTIIISGLGSYTILDILSRSRKVKKLIISSNNNWELVRKSISKLGYYLKEERLIKDGKILYSIMVFDNSSKNNTKAELNIGKYNKMNKKEYLVYYTNSLNIYHKIPYTKISKKLKYYFKLKKIKKYLNKKDRMI